MSFIHNTNTGDRVQVLFFSTRAEAEKLKHSLEVHHSPYPLFDFHIEQVPTREQVADPQ